MEDQEEGSNGEQEDREKVVNVGVKREHLQDLAGALLDLLARPNAD